MRILILTGVAALAMTGAALAQPPGGGDPAAVFAAIDTDSNGTISKEEWLAGGQRRERGFDFMDADKNGELTTAELQAGMQAMRARQQGQ